MISTSMRLGRQLTLAVFLFAGTMCARANDPVFLPGFRVGLVPATSKLRPSQFGFEEFLGARVLIVELQAALHTRITNEYGPIGLQRLGATVESYEALKVGDADGYLARGRLAADGTQIWSFVFRSTDLAAVVLVRVPRSVSHTYSDAVVRKMLDSIAVRGKLSIEDQVAALGYRIGDPAGFRVAGARAGGGVTLTEGPIDEVVDIEQPSLVISLDPRSVSPSKFSNVTNDVMANLARVPQIASVATVHSGPLNTKQCNGWEAVSDVKAKRNGASGVAVAWVCVFSRSGHLTLLGLGQKDLWSSVLPRFQKVRDSISLNR